MNDYEILAIPNDFIEFVLAQNKKIVEIAADNIGLFPSDDDPLQECVKKLAIFSNSISKLKKAEETVAMAYTWF